MVPHIHHTKLPHFPMLQDPTLAPENKGDTLKPSHPVQVEEAAGSKFIEKKWGHGLMVQKSGQNTTCDGQYEPSIQSYVFPISWNENISRLVHTLNPQHFLW